MIYSRSTDHIDWIWCVPERIAINRCPWIFIPSRGLVWAPVSAVALLMQQMTDDIKRRLYIALLE